MKKILMLAIVGLFAFSLVACGSTAKDQSPAADDGSAETTTLSPEEATTPEEQAALLGGWKIAESDIITDELREVFDAATADLEAEGTDCHPIMYIGDQLVNGTNRCYIADITDVMKNKNYFALVFIHEDLDGAVQLVNMHELEGVQYANEYDFRGDDFTQYFNENASED